MVDGGKTAEEIAAEEAAAEVAAAEALELEGPFDAERATRTILAQRKSETKLKGTVAEQAARLATFEAAEAKALDAEKTLEQRLTDSETRNTDLQADLATSRAEFAFRAEAAEAGLDAGLAYLVAKKDGVIGSYDDDTGELTGHDLDALAEAYPALVKDRSQIKPRPGGDAARKAKDSGTTPKERFNELIRAQL